MVRGVTLLHVRDGRVVRCSDYWDLASVRRQLQVENLDGATYAAGTVAMANAGPGTNGSQFFLVHADSQLPPSYTVLGTITEGLDVVTGIAERGTGAVYGGPIGERIVARAVKEGLIDAKHSIQIGIRTHAPADCGIEMIYGHEIATGGISRVTSIRNVMKAPGMSAHQLRERSVR